MVTAISGPRVLLRQLRETMAESLAAQARLDKIVNLIADNMRADVCSFYVLRDDGALELFATRGLAPGAVHQTTLASRWLPSSAQEPLVDLERHVSGAPGRPPTLAR